MITQNYLLNKKLSTVMHLVKNGLPIPIELFEQSKVISPEDIEKEKIIKKIERDELIKRIKQEEKKKTLIHDAYHRVIKIKEILANMSYDEQQVFLSEIDDDNPYISQFKSAVLTHVLCRGIDFEYEDPKWFQEYKS